MLFLPQSIHLQRTREGAKQVCRATRGSFGYDLAAVGPHTIPPHQTVVVPTGFKLASPLPKAPSGEAGLAMLILPRSSLPIKYGLIVANAPGLIDADYTGEIGVIVHNITDKYVNLADGMRIAQALFVWVALPVVDEVADFEAREERGGFGSTGA